MAMAGPASSTSDAIEVLTLQEKLAAVEKRLVELENRYKDPPRQTEANVPKDTDGTLEGTGEVNSVGEPSTAPKPEQSEKGHEGPVPRVKVIVSRRDPTTGEQIEEDRQVTNNKDPDRDKHAFMLRKRIYGVKFDPYGEPNDSEIEIISPGLWRLLQKHLGDYPYHTFRDAPVPLNSPFWEIVQKFDELRDAALPVPTDSDEEKQAREDLTLLLDIICGGASGDEKLDKYFKIRKIYRSQTPNTVQFDDLWTVFPPGTLVYGRPFQNEDQVFVVRDGCHLWPELDTRRRGSRELLPWRLEAWSYDWNGESNAFELTDYDLTFEPFDGPLPLTSLPYFPFEMHLEFEEISKKLVKRGKQFREIVLARGDERLFEYYGKAIFEMKGFSGMKYDDEENEGSTRSSSFSEALAMMAGRAPPRNAAATNQHQPEVNDIRGRVMVDYESYFKYGPPAGRNGSLTRTKPGFECACSDCTEKNEGLAKRWRLRFNAQSDWKKWEDEQYLICPPRVLGYVLEEKMWAQLQVTMLDAIEYNQSEAWNSRLRLGDDDDEERRRDEHEKANKRAVKKGTKGVPFDDRSTKKMLLDLVRSHSTPGQTSADQDEDRLEVDDIIPGKGKGLIVLLYGPPGVGKTSTAETIAIAARKPLFSISVADVGTKAKHVESNLSWIFSLATKWQAILLIDEADVFLESRGRGNAIQSTDKNALVSVFLRVLEYYQGIMFLTTNQIAQFDVAIPSRIHVAIQYKNLKQAQMQRIFRGFLDKLRDKNLIEDYESIMDWLDETVYREAFDGRQIRNIVTTALGLARAETMAGPDGNANGNGRGKLALKHMKRAFANVSAFKKDFATQMRRYEDSQSGMIQLGS